MPNFFSTGLVHTGFHLPLSGIHGFLDRNGNGKGRANEPMEEDVGILQSSYSAGVHAANRAPSALSSHLDSGW